MNRLSFFSNEQESLKFYKDNGYFIEYNLIDESTCDELIEASKNFETALDETYKPTMMPHRANSKVFETFSNSKILHIMSKLVGGEVAGLQTEFFFCKPGTRGFANHQDNYFVEANNDVFASAWIALTDTYPEKGGLIAYPGTHKEGMLQTKKIFVENDTGQDPNANNEEVIIPEQYSPINPYVPKGSVFFIHGALVHGSNRNITQEWRYVLLCTYIKKGESFRPGRYAKREAVEFIVS